MSENVAAVPEGGHVEKVGGFDIRNFIGLLIGIYGLALLVWGLFFFVPEEAAKTGGVNANLYAGIGMLLFGAAFILWARVRPIKIVVVETDEGAEVPKDIAPTD